MEFSLTVLGSNAAIPGNNRNLSAHVLNAHERLFLIDCGEGTQFQLRRYHISLQRLGCIFISHLHGDHFFGLVGLLNSMHLLGRKNELHLFGPSGLMEIINIQMEASLTTLCYPLAFHELPTGKFSLILEKERISVYSFPLRHSIPAWGFLFREINPPRRISEARSFAYCSDTGYSEEILPYIGKVTLLYHEATFMHDLAAVAADKLHSTALEAATIAAKAGVKKLLLGHFSARYDDLGPLVEEARSVFPESYPAEEGTTYRL
jgi:ribonuclease Z